MSDPTVPLPTDPSQRRPSLITFLSDFGHADTFVGVCHGVMLQIAPEARIVDLTHDVPPQDVATGAYRLRDCVPHLAGAVHLAVVDPGVGSDRAGIAVAAGPVDAPTWLVGPDNGLLIGAAERLGGIRSVWRLVVPAGASTTFHGRDVFAPAAARLAVGMLPDAFAEPLTDDPVRLPEPSAGHVDSAAGRVVTAVRDIDRFGNVQLFAEGAAMRALGGPGTRVMVERRPGGGRPTATAAALVVDTFAALPGAVPGVLVDSTGHLALAVAGGSAAAALGLGRGAAVVIATGPSGSASA